jgi:hypothetical protein
MAGEVVDGFYMVLRDTTSTFTIYDLALRALADRLGK